MTTEFKTMEQLTAEIRHLHQRVAELETWKSPHEWVLEAYRRSEAKFQSLAENSGAGVCIVQDGIVKYVNPKTAAIFGYAFDELVDNVSAKILVWPEDWSMVEENLRCRICGKEETTGYQFRGITKNGEIIRVEIYCSSVDYEGGPALMCTLLDITQRARAEAELERQANKFRVLYDLAVAMTADNSLDDNLSMVVKQSRKFLGFDASYIAHVEDTFDSFDIQLIHDREICRDISCPLTGCHSLLDYLQFLFLEVNWNIRAFEVVYGSGVI